MALPCAYVFAFKLGLSIEGLWMGIGIGPVIQMFLFLWLILRADWTEIALNVKLQHFRQQKLHDDSFSACV